MSISNQSILIGSKNTTVKLYSPFRIQLIEDPFENCAWEFIFPPQINLINTNRYFEGPLDTREWEFTASSPGTYLLRFYYRKQCCSRMVVKSEVYTITVI